MRVSKYKLLEGQTFSIKDYQVKVIRYHKELKISKKSGKKYYTYRLDVQLKDFQDILEISTTSWKKQSFIKRLVKISINPSKPVVYSCLPVVYNPVQKDFLTRTLNPDEIINKVEYFETVKDVRKWFKDYAKYYHPDFLGRKQSPFERDAYNELVFIRDEAIEIIKLFEDTFGVKLA